MNAQRLAALGGLGLVVALVVGLIATNGDDDTPATEATIADSASPAEPGSDSAVSEPTDTDSTETNSIDSDSADPDSAGAESTDTDPVATEPTDAALSDPNVPDLPDRGTHLPLLEIDGWLQSDVESLEELRGKVVAVQFWTFGCVNCRNTMQQNVALYEKYGGDDFEIVGIHAPEFDFERDPDRILESAAEQNITWPIVLDTEKRTFHSWQEGRRGFWPRVYLLDRDGNVRYDRIGEYGDSGFEELDAAVGALIAGA
ncbi:MAG: redoxin domain-containing protein [Actinomycetota bacterium]